jgi:hypothetical protein
MRYPRFDHNLTILPDGSVMAIGGSSKATEYSDSGTLPSEVWDPATNTWTVLASVHHPRVYHSTSALLPDGRVVSGGGGSLSPNVDYREIEFFSPPYLFRGPRPVIAAGPADISYGQTLSITTPDAARIRKVSLIPYAAVTHTIDMNQRFVELAFTAGSGGLSVSAPADPNVATPGVYMLFILNDQGVPSMAHTVKLGGSAAPRPTPTPTPVATAVPAGRTLGNTHIGLTLDTNDSNFLNGSRITTGATAVTARSISVYVGNIDSSTANRSYQMAIYADAGGRPGALFGVTSVGTLTANAWNTLPITATLAPNTSYWLMYNTNGRTSSVNNMRMDLGALGQGAYSASSVPFGAWPTSFGASVGGPWNWSIYLSY